MSLFARSNFVFAIIFGCFAVLIPRLLLPLFRSKPTSPSQHMNDHFRRTPMSRSDHDDTVEHVSGSSPDTHGVHPNMRMHHSNANSRQQLSTDQSQTKSALTFALPMYTVGIALFFIYTCFKYWAKRNTQEDKIKTRFSTNNIQWNAHKKKFKYYANNRQDDAEAENEEDLYAGLDPEYVEYLKVKRQKESETEHAITTDQNQMNHTLDEMKDSLSFITSKIGKHQTKTNLTNNEISQLQNRLASTEAQMYKILNALDAASSQVNALSKSTRQSLEQPQQTFIGGENPHRSSPSCSESEDNGNDDDNSDSDENSSQQDEEIPFDDKQRQEDQSSSSYEDDEEIPNEADDDGDDDEDESEASADRYGIMDTNYGCDPTNIEDYEIDAIRKPNQTSDSQSKVQEWHERNHSQSLSSSNSSIEQDQSIPNDEQNCLTQRKQHDR